MDKNILTDGFLLEVRKVVEKRRADDSFKFSILQSKIDTLSRAISKALPMVADEIVADYGLLDIVDSLADAFTGTGKVARELKNYMLINQLLDRDRKSTFTEEFEDAFIRELEEIDIRQRRRNLLSTVQLIQMFADPEDPTITLTYSHDNSYSFFPAGIDAAYEKGLALYRTTRKRPSWQAGREELEIAGARLLVVPFFVLDVKTVFFIYTELHGNREKLAIEGFQFNHGEGYWYKIENKSVIGTERILWRTIEVFFLELIKERHAEEGWSHMRSPKFSTSNYYSDRCADIVHRRLIEYFVDGEKFKSISDIPFELKLYTSSNTIEHDDGELGTRVHRWLEIRTKGKRDQHPLRLEFFDNRNRADGESVFRVQLAPVYGDRLFDFEFDKMVAAPRLFIDALFFVYFFACELLALSEFKRIHAENTADQKGEK